MPSILTIFRRKNDEPKSFTDLKTLKIITLSREPSPKNSRKSKKQLPYSQDNEPYFAEGREEETIVDPDVAYHNYSHSLKRRLSQSKGFQLTSAEAIQQPIRQQSRRSIPAELLRRHQESDLADFMENLTEMESLREAKLKRDTERGSSRSSLSDSISPLADIMTLSSDEDAFICADHRTGRKLGRKTINQSNSRSSSLSRNSDIEYNVQREDKEEEQLLLRKLRRNTLKD